MEIERLKALQEMDQKRTNRKVATYEGCSKIIDQIKEREVIRLREEEMQEKERFQMLKNIELAKEADAKILVVKKDRI